MGGRKKWSGNHEPLWYKDAIFYQLRIPSFFDGDADGVGDLRGLTEKLGYLQDLGVTALWVLPFYPSPMRDDGYDIADYLNVHPDCGTLEDFRAFLEEAHRRGLRVITELVINHTSDQHPWFQRARRSPPGSRWRNYYVWSDTAERYRQARIIFGDFETSNWTWDPIAHAYYWHRFYSHQPDLNFDSPDVRREVFRALDFWLDMGVDGMRLDAIPYLFERPGTNCENLPETHAFLKDLRRHVDRKYRNRMFLAEANQWPEDAVAYFGEGDECHMAFHFPVMPRLFMALHMEDRYPIVDILAQTPAIPDICQWAMFLRNHDELTLEMVTDEERDYMYRTYAHDQQARINLGIRRRLAPLLGKDRRRIELMNALLFSLPGTPIIYYGDEIGMGDNFYLGDRNGVRTPMQWNADRNAGFSSANPQRLYLPIVIDPEYHYETVNVETHQGNLRSLLWWMKRLIALRKRHLAFGRGSIEFLAPANRKVVVFLRRYDSETILVVANLSRFVQYAEIDLSAYRGKRVVEIFGGTPFPLIGELPYLLTLGPHSFYWFLIEEPREEDGAIVAAPQVGLPLLKVAGSWEAVLGGASMPDLERVLPAYLRQCRWFGGKGQSIRRVWVRDVIRVPEDQPRGCVALLGVEYPAGIEETYVLPLAYATGARAADLRRWVSHAVVARLEAGNGREKSTQGILYDASEDESFNRELLDAIAGRKSFKGASGQLVALQTRSFRRLRGPGETELAPSVMRAEQSNTCVAYDKRFLLKLFRRPVAGINPDFEVGRFLTERSRFEHVAPVAGALEYRVRRQEPVTLGILHGFVENAGDAWRYTLDEVRAFFERALARGTDGAAVPVPDESLLALVENRPPVLARELFGTYLESARMLGRRTAELHLALATRRDDPPFAPEPFTTLYQRSRYQSMRNLAVQLLAALREGRDRLPESVRPPADELLERQQQLLDSYRWLVGRKLAATRIRCHGDYHLGQVLYTGKDFVIIDFEGEPARPLSDRRQKRSPLVDVAGMLRSFDYAVETPLRGPGAHGSIREADIPKLERWARFWERWVSSAFLRAYLHSSARGQLLPEDPEELRRLLDLFLLDKCTYEIGYEMDNRPEWLAVPIRGMLRLLEELTK